MEDESKIIELNIADTIMERPYGFRINGQQFYLYPVTLGKTYLISRLTGSLELNNRIISVNPYIEALRICDEKKDVVCRLLAYHTFNKKEELFNSSLIDERSNFFSGNLGKEEMSQLLVIALSDVDIDTFIKHFGIDREKKEQEKIMRVKNDKNSFSFGGKSIYGTIIDVACERYGWTMDYVVWGISYTNLRMLLIDHVTSIYLTDEEKKKVHISSDRTFINADNPENLEKIKSMGWD